MAVIPVMYELDARIIVPKIHPESLNPNGRDNMPIPINVFIELNIVCGTVDSPVRAMVELEWLSRLINVVVSSWGKSKVSIRLNWWGRLPTDDSSSSIALSDCPDGRIEISPSAAGVSGDVQGERSSSEGPLSTARNFWALVYDEAKLLIELRPPALRNDSLRDDGITPILDWKA